MFNVIKALGSICVVGSLAVPGITIQSQAASTPKKVYRVGGREDIILSYEGEENSIAASEIVNSDWKIGDIVGIDKNKNFDFLTNLSRHNQSFLVKFMGVESDGKSIRLDVEIKSVGLHWGFSIKSDELVDDFSRYNLNQKGKFKVIAVATLNKPDESNNKIGFYSYPIVRFLDKHFIYANNKDLSKISGIQAHSLNGSSDYATFKEDSKINFLSSWGKKNSGSGRASFSGVITKGNLNDTEGEIENQLQKKIKEKFKNDSSIVAKNTIKEIDSYKKDIAHEVVIIKKIDTNIIGLNVIPEYSIENPPVNDIKYKYSGFFNGNYIEKEYLLDLPSGAGYGSEWWRAVIQVTTGGIGNLVHKLVNHLGDWSSNSSLSEKDWDTIKDNKGYSDLLNLKKDVSINYTSGRVANFV